jgi:NAD-dependent dihydropyrimidine dehydrogenase PreA subunit
MGQVRIDATACTACGRCIEICPTDVMRADPGTGRAIVMYEEDCSGCQICTAECPTDCIFVEDLRSGDAISIYDVLSIEDKWPPAET